MRHPLMLRGQSEPTGGSRLTRRAGMRAAASSASAAAVGLVAACAPGQGGGAPSAATRGPVTLRYALDEIVPAGQGTYSEGRQLITAAFMAPGGPIRVEIEAVKPVYAAILTQAAAGDPPDVTMTHPREYHPFVNAGALLELDSYLKRDKRNVPDVVPSVLEYWTRDGHTYGLPNAHAVQAIYYNRAAFQRQGLKTPDQYEKEGTWTFETYLELSRRLTAGTADTKVWGGFWPNNTLDIQAGFLWSFGGDLWDKTLENTLLDSKESLEAIQFQADLTARYGVSPTAEERQQLPSGNGGTLAAERAPTEILMTTALGMLTRAPFPLGMAPMPKGRAGRVVRGAPLGVQLMKGATHHDAAWEFGNFHAGLEAERIMLGLHLAVAWHRSSLGSAAFAKQLQPWEDAAAYTESVNTVRPTRYPGKFSEIDRIYSAAFDTVRHGQSTAAQAMAESKPQITALLRQK